MRRAVGVLLLVFGEAVMLGQDAPLQSGPLPVTVVTDAPERRGGAAGGYSMEPGMADHAPAVPEIVKPTYRGSGDAIKANFPPKLLKRVDAQYAEEARKKKISGTVVVTALVVEDGTPTDVRVDRRIGYGLNEKAVEALRQYRFRPAMKDGKPVPQHVAIEVSFHIF